ncbi:MAG TPA: tetratricopeptide repeat protein [Gemmatimonadota bacterium]|nr:tetratricopeptide repeat protein [Gemmatimonadota bacterium]
MEFRALGSIELRVAGVVAADVLAQPKRFSLFAFLALGGYRSHRRDTLVALLWPESDQSHARHALRQSIYYLRNHLDESLLVVRGEEIAVDRDRLWCDVDELDRAWERGHLERVAELYRGDLLEGFHATGAGNEFEFWLERERFRLQGIAGEANRLLAESALARGDTESAIRWATARRAVQPADEGALLGLMRLLNEAGRRESALESYRGFVAQSGYPGSEELEALALELQAEAERGWSSRMVSPPTMPGTLIGRRRSIEEALSHLKSGARLLTLTGTGGVGKTRLAIEVARGAERSFEGAVAWVSLAPIRDASALPDVVAEAVGLEPRPAGFDEGQLVSWLSVRKLLLVLDNFEHLLQGSPFVAQLLRTCPRLSILVTSRAPLKLRGEQELEVLPLTLPDPSRRLGQELPFDSEAVALFVDRVRALSPSFRLTDDNADAVIEICRRLEGLPLAIELAAPRTKIMSSAALASRLEKQLPLLTAGPRDLPERQRTLHDAIRWSVELLDPAERELLFGLSVFAGGCDLEAVERVVEMVAGPDGDPLDLLTALIDTSLLRRTESADGESRFTMLESIREYGAAALERAGRAEVWRTAHARHYAAWVETGCRARYCTPGEAGWFDRITEEHENLNAAMRWSLAGGDAECAVRIAASVAHFWCVRGRLAEGRSWLDRILAARVGLKEPLRVRVLAAAAHLRSHQGLWGEAIVLHEEVVARRRSMGDRKVLVGALHNLGATQLEAGLLEEARASMTESLAIAEELGDDLNAAFSLTGLGTLARIEGRFSVAKSSLVEALARARKTRQEAQAAVVLREMADVARAEGETEAALHLLEEAAATLDELGRVGDLAATIERMGEIREAPEPDLARRLYARAIRLYRESGYMWGVGRGLARFARIALDDGLPGRCIELMAGAEALCPVQDASDRKVLDRARATAGEGTSAACWATGHAMSLERLLRLADELVPAVEIAVTAGLVRQIPIEPGTSAEAGSAGVPAGSG